MLARLARRHVDAEEIERQQMSWSTYQSLFSFNGSQYATTPYGNGVNGSLICSVGPVSAVLDRRVSVMAEARPTWQAFQSGKPARMFSTPALDVLKNPWPGGTFRDLVSVCESDAAACGNSYWVRLGTRLQRLDPAWTTIVTEVVEYDGVKIGEWLIGYAVAAPGQKAVGFAPDEVAHYRPGAPVGSQFRGESWLASVTSDASSDQAMTQYKLNYLRNGAMPSLAVMYEPTISQERLEQFVGVFADKFTGSMNAGKIMHLLGGRDVKTVGATLDQLAYKAVQGAGETRIAAAAGVPAAVAMFSEGLSGSSLNAGNYTATRRLFGDAKIRPLLGSFFDAFATLVPPPTGSRLWYDDSGVSFFQEDVTDEAQIRQMYAATIRTLIEAGYEPDAAVAAATNGDFAGLLGSHTGLVSVQLQEPGAHGDPVDDSGGGNA
jgi:Phage portal protein